MICSNHKLFLLLRHTRKEDIPHKITMLCNDSYPFTRRKPFSKSLSLRSTYNENTILGVPAQDVQDANGFSIRCYTHRPRPHHSAIIIQKNWLVLGPLIR